MNQTYQRDSDDPLGLEASRAIVLRQILATADGLNAGASDDDLDAWWGDVEADRLASGLTLEAITKLAAPSHEAEPIGPWIQKSDPAGDGTTQLTAAGRTAVRRMLAVRELSAG